jgi:2-keto-4-pentenoate hydratase
MTTLTEELATRLVRAMSERAPLAIEDFPVLAEDDAYEVQRAFVHHLCGDGERCRVGFKLSMTSPETQALAAATGPAYGTFTSGTIVRNRTPISLGDFFEPRLELELQVLVEEDLSAGADVDEIVSRCSLAPGIEVPDSRFRGWYGNLPVGHIVSDLGLAGRVVVGEGTPLSEVTDRPGIRGELHHDDRVVASGDASNVMGDPVNAVRWLAERLAREGRALKQGDVISSGTLCMPVPAAAGRYRATYQGIGEVAFSLMP